MLLILGCILVCSVATVHPASDHPKILLNDGRSMPVIGFGTFGKIDEIYRVEDAVISAIEAGYRLIDTAATYYNEEEIGKAIKNVTDRGIVKREDLFISTKLTIGFNASMVQNSLQTSLNKLQLDYVDMYLIHMPYNWITLEEFDLVGIWKEMEKARRLGLAKSIGVSNFNSSHINKILLNCEVRPAVNEVEVNPTYASLELVAYCKKEGIAVISYGPLDFLVPRPFRNDIPPPAIDNPILTKLATKYGKSVLQIYIRYLIDRGTIPIPKAFTKSHMLENIDVWDFSLSTKDIYLLNEFNLNMKVYDFSVDIADAFTRYYYGVGVEDFFPSN